MDKFREEIQRSIKALSHKEKLIFAVLVCDRLYPNYVAFQVKESWGDHQVLKEAINLLYLLVFDNREPDIYEVEEMIASVETITPDTENFNDIYVSFALDACSSVYSSLSFIIDHNDEHIIDVVTYARDTVDMFIQEKEDLSPSDSALEEKIKSDIAMVRFEQWLNDVTIKLESSRSEKFTNEILLSLREDKAIIELDLLA